MTSPELDPYRQRAAIRRRRRLLILLPLLPVMTVLGIVVAEFRGPGPVNIHEMLVFGGILVAVNLVSILGVLAIIRWRTGRWGPELPAIAGASMQTRRQVLRNVRRGILPSDEPDRTLAVDLARTLMRQRRVLWILPIAGVAQLINVAIQEQTSTRLLFLAAACCFFAASVLTWVQRRGARSLIARFDKE